MWPVSCLPFDGIPAAVALGLRLQSGPQAVARQHAVRLQGQEILRVEVLRVLERAASETHRGQGQRSRSVRDHVGNRGGVQGQFHSSAVEVVEQREGLRIVSLQTVPAVGRLGAFHIQVTMCAKIPHGQLSEELVVV